jgi:hypothetical protein
MNIAFTNHALDRVQARLGIRPKAGQIMNITGAFKYHRTYWDHRLSQIVQSWYCPDQRVVFIIADEPGNNGAHAVITVLTQGPVVDAVYHQAQEAAE